MIEVRKTYKNLQLLQAIDDVHNICCWSQTKQSSHAVARMPKSHLKNLQMSCRFRDAIHRHINARFLIASNSVRKKRVIHAVYA